MFNNHGKDLSHNYIFTILLNTLWVKLSVIRNPFIFIKLLARSYTTKIINCLPAYILASFFIYSFLRIFIVFIPEILRVSLYLVRCVNAFLIILFQCLIPDEGLSTCSWAISHFYFFSMYQLIY